MRLQLHINGRIFHEIDLPKEEIEDAFDSDSIDDRKETMDMLVKSFKNMMYKYIDKARSWQIYLVADSRMNESLESRINMENLISY